MNINLTPLIQAIIAVLAALITYKLIPWIKSKTTKQQQDNLQALVRVLVYAAEQIYGAGNGPEKLEYVCRELRERGYEVDLSEIEAAVYNAFNFDTLMVKPVKDENPDIVDGVDVNIAHWPLEQLKAFCEDNGIDCAGCETREDYMDAIEKGGRVSDEPPSEAAEGRDE